MAHVAITPQSEPTPPSNFDKLRENLGAGFQRLAQVVGDSRRPLPDQSGDGTYLDIKPDSPDVIQRIEATLGDLKNLGITDVDTLIKVASKAKSGEPWDDKKYLMEKLIMTAAKFPDNSATGQKLTNTFLSTLYNDLQHPPISYLGDNYAYRSADGSYNSLVHPDLGKAGTPYARTVAPKSMQPGALPSPSVIFDSIMARKPENVTPHPNKISSMLFYLASIIIHDLFRTDHLNFHNSKTSSYLDLAPLYGSDLTEQMRMRTGLDGKIKPDCFSETRLLQFPPGVGCILIMFNRFHNNVVEQLATINEKKQFTRPQGDAPSPNYGDKEWWTKLPADWKKFDETLFQTGRLITSGLYINIILLDYVRTILNLNKTNSNWALNPRADIHGVEVASGNQVSAEFNLVYRWHSAISARDEDWTNKLWTNILKGKDPNTITMMDFLKDAQELEMGLQAKTPTERDFHGLKREQDGTFNDDDLVKILTESVEDVANSYGANRVPKVMRIIEVLGIQQARSWNVATLNEFRKHFNLTPHQTFEDINSNPQVADQLRHLYDHPDQVELYPGMVAEEPKVPVVPGAGLTPSFTVSRAVLSDAVALVRGDRFYTVDYHPKKLTNWGYSAAATDTAIDNGCVAYKLFLTAFPNHFRPNSIYAHYPMTIPSEMESVMKALGRHEHYSYDRPGRFPDTISVKSYAGVKSVFSNPTTFNVTWGGAVDYLLGGEAKVGAVGTEDSLKTAELHKAVKDLTDESWLGEVREYFEKATAKALSKKAYKLAALNQVDIVRDVGNLVPVYFVSELFSLPLKSEANPSGVFSTHEMYLALLAVYTSFSKDIDSIESHPLRQISRSAVQLLGSLVQGQLDPSVLDKLISFLTPSEATSHGTHKGSLKDHGHDLIKALEKAHVDTKTIAWVHILTTAAGTSASIGRTFALVIEYLIQDANKAHLAAASKLALQDTPAAFAQLTGYVLEAARLAGPASRAYRKVAAPGTVNGTSVKPGQRVLLDLAAAARDGAAFPDPDKFDPCRPVASYEPLGWTGAHAGLGWEVSRTAVTAMVRCAVRLGKLRPAAGDQGKIWRAERAGRGAGVAQGEKAFLTENFDGIWPVAQCMKVNWD
ncbi:heme peroxidase [Trichodelitschia bisporula]|uniref:Heme peroxidase n=1 Tax=Trichodelitschia bisporula TaxID=703511 RepID=A0A6G1I5Z2_9PEZI|nr:heme peroxidase [Trichodelitschia bisporula]